MLCYAPALSDPNFILGGGFDGGVSLGALLELILIAANVGTALALYPVLRKHSEALSLGYIANGLILGYLMWKTRLVPRAMSILGLVGGPAVLVSGIAVMFGMIDAGSAVQAIATVPEFLWKLSLGLWLLVKGFDCTALGTLDQISQR